MDKHEVEDKLVCGTNISEFFLRRTMFSSCSRPASSHFRNPMGKHCDTKSFVFELTDYSVDMHQSFRHLSIGDLMEDPHSYF